MRLSKLGLVLLLLLAIGATACASKSSGSATKKTKDLARPTAIKIPTSAFAITPSSAPTRPTATLVIVPITPGTPTLVQGTPTRTATPVKAAALLNGRCTVCHTADRIKSAKKSAADWKATVERMIDKGASLTPAEKDSLISYLAATYK